MLSIVLVLISALKHLRLLMPQGGTSYGSESVHFCSRRGTIVGNVLMESAINGVGKKSIFGYGIYSHIAIPPNSLMAY